VIYNVLVAAAILALFVGAGYWWTKRRARVATLIATLTEFFGQAPDEFSIVSRKFAMVDLPNLQRAIDRVAARQGSHATVIGYSTEFGGSEANLRAMIAKSGLMGRVMTSVNLAPVVQRDVDIGVDERLLCVENGIHLLVSPQGKAAIHVCRSRYAIDLEIEVLAATSETGARLIEEIRSEIAAANVYRHKILSLECDPEHWGGSGHANVRFHRFPIVRREDIILPEATLQLLERNTTRFFQYADEIKRSGRSVKRGLLLHGRPGTGKTFTAKWLASSLEQVTVILLSGEQLWLIKQCCQMARMLAPAMVIMEDVDLVATARDAQQNSTRHVTLHQLLNEMDGLASDAEVLFLLTTNRPAALEAALAARPGRIDQAIEYPLPDAECRRRLLELYGRGLILRLDDLESLIARTEGASPAFLQELLRKAALVAAEDRSTLDGQLVVCDHHADTALKEILLGGGAVTQKSFGIGRENTASLFPQVNVGG
jgi:hypothetical protein